MAVAAPSHKTEYTGSALLDRIQANVHRLVQVVHQLVTTVEARRVVPVMLASSFTTTAATAQSTKLTFAVIKGECWDVEVWAYGACSSVNGMKYAVAVPVGSTFSGTLESSSTNTAVANWTIQDLSASTLSAATHVGASNAGRPDRINVRVTAGASGFITLQAASTTAGTTTTISAMALLRASKVAAV